MANSRFDFLVIGSGLAGLSAALRLSRHGSVAVLSKKKLLNSNTDKAQGGIAGVSSSEDSFDLHSADTLRAGAGLCDETVVKTIIQQGPEVISELAKLGVPFARNGQRYELGLEGGHTKRRVLHVEDTTGHSIAEALVAACCREKNITLLEHCAAVDLLLDEHARDLPPESNRCHGAYYLDSRSGKVRALTASFTLLASGGAGKVYKYTTNPEVATGDGMAMAFRAGVPLKNMEFVQFHPTCLYHSKLKSFLISEAVRGEGAILRLQDGTAFMKKYSPQAELAPRDIVARAIDAELKKTGAECVYLDATALGAAFLEKRFPNIFKTCLAHGLDITKQPIPVVPAAHFFCGGVAVDSRGATAMPGLYAAGETACTGLHGANRLASNSLLEACVCARTAADDMLKRFLDGERAPLRKNPPRWETGDARHSDEAVVVQQNWDEIRTLMWNYVGIVRSDTRLERARRRLRLIQEEIRQYYWKVLPTRDVLELRNIACVAEAIILSATSRRESRGLHFNTDCPRTRPQWNKPTLIDRYRP